MVYKLLPKSTPVLFKGIPDPALIGRLNSMKPMGPQTITGTGQPNCGTSSIIFCDDGVVCKVKGTPARYRAIQEEIHGNKGLKFDISPEYNAMLVDEKSNWLFYSSIESVEKIVPEMAKIKPEIFIDYRSIKCELPRHFSPNFKVMDVECNGFSAPNGPHIFQPKVDTFEGQFKGLDAPKKREEAVKCLATLIKESFFENSHNKNEFFYLHNVWVMPNSTLEINAAGMPVSAKWIDLGEFGKADLTVEKPLANIQYAIEELLRGDPVNVGLNGVHDKDGADYKTLFLGELSGLKGSLERYWT